MTIPQTTTDTKILGVDDISPIYLLFSEFFNFRLELVEEYSLLL